MPDALCLTLPTQGMGMGAYSNTSRQFDCALAAQADVIYCMTESHMKQAAALLQGDAGAIQKLKLMDPTGADIDDPIGCSQEVYNEVGARLACCLPIQLEAHARPIDPWPMQKLTARLSVPSEAPTAVVLTTGGMNPVHRGHVALVHQAAARLDSAGFNVIGCWLSPSHDKYLQPKVSCILTPARSLTHLVSTG